ncbi:hypothetical protein NPX13_g2253 [Xylaria arbuscula]|uniref:Uncharacterized protein n=1 Tax=Xylaria arbuscula TaxID=114810 RepID=A0A9W8NJJ5_9PEZI|nr:hypothetical protein NPX13_g2253 [Xylaria arbuscula]
MQTLRAPGSKEQVRRFLRLSLEPHHPCIENFGDRRRVTLKHSDSAWRYDDTGVESYGGHFGMKAYYVDSLPEIKTLNEATWQSATPMLAGVHTGDGSKKVLWKNCTAQYKRPGEGDDVEWKDAGAVTGEWLMPYGWKLYLTGGDIRRSAV